MSKWTKATLGDVSSVITGPFGSQLHQSDYVDDGVASIMPQNIGDRTVNLDGIAYITEMDANRLKRYRVKKADLVHSRRGDVEKHAFITDELSGSLCGTGCLRVRITDDSVYPEYISLYLDRPETKTWIRQHAVGSSMPNLNSGILSDIPIKYPHYKEQILITRVLCALENKIALNKRINAELEAMAKTLYDYWFVQFDFSDENGKPYRTSGGAMEWNEQLKREIPKGWNVQRLETCISKVSTGLNPRDNFKLGNGEIKYVTVKNLRIDGTIDFSNCDSVDSAARNIIHERSDISVGDILFASIAPLGRCYLIQDPPSDWDINESVFSIRPNYQCVTSAYVYMYLMSDSFIAKASSSSTGSIFKGIRIGTLLDMPITVPPKHITDAFSESISELISLKHKKGMESDELISLRDWLLPMLMNGQAMVSTEENTAEDSKIVELPKANDERFSLWLQNQGIAARGELDKKTLREIFDAMDDDDK